MRWIVAADLLDRLGTLCGGGGALAAIARGLDLGKRTADLDGRAFVRKNLDDFAGSRRGDFDVDFVGGHVDERLAVLDRIADALPPGCDGAFGYRLAHFWQCDDDARIRHKSCVRLRLFRPWLTCDVQRMGGQRRARTLRIHAAIAASGPPSTDRCPVV